MTKESQVSAGQGGAMEVNKGRRSYKKRPYTIVVEGNIGSGKTTFLQPFATLKQVVFVVVARTRAFNVPVQW